MTDDFTSILGRKSNLPNRQTCAQPHLERSFPLTALAIRLKPIADITPSWPAAAPMPAPNPVVTTHIPPGQFLLAPVRHPPILATMFDLQAYMAVRGRMIDGFLESQMPSADTRPAGLHRAMRYSLFAGGKRLRPILCIAAAEACGAVCEQVLFPAGALELLHTYTLIHDDLPCMDDDALRRGRATCHIAFDEATALLAGDALLTLAFEWLAASPPPPPAGPLDLVRELASAAGSLGVIAGQAEDMAAESLPPSPALLDFIHSHKTARLIRAAMRMGGLAAGAAAPALEALSAYGEAVGVAFQIADDILNATSTAEALGKPVGSDAARGKLTFPALHGLDASRARAAALVEDACRALARLPGHTAPLEALARHAVSRSS